MSSFFLPSINYHLLNSDVDEDQIMEEYYEKRNKDFSSSAPAIVDNNDITCESKR